ncbi:MAG: ATP-binding protein [Pseudomonadota bacterium]
MSDDRKTRKELLEELRELRLRCPRLEAESVNRMDQPINASAVSVRDAVRGVPADTENEGLREALSAMFNSMPDAILVHDEKGLIEYANDGAAEILGLGRRAKSRPLDSADAYYGPMESRPLLREIWGEVIEGTPRSFEWQVRRMDEGAVFDAEVYLRNIRLKGRYLVLAAVRDISERKRVERALQKALETAVRLRAEAEAASQAKSEFLANVSHELRTPLNAIMGFAELLVSETFGELNDRQSGYVNEIYGAGDHLLQLINGILDLAKIEVGRMDLQLSDVNLGLLLEHCLLMVKERAMKHRLQIELKVAEGINRALFRADEVKLKQILFNLLSNAAKFTPDGGLVVLAAERQKDEVVISITDTGIGIDPEDQSRIFHPFEQVDSSLVRRHQGTGLGLALTRRLVELHNGRLWLESRGKDKGSAFRFTVPFIEAETETDAGRSAKTTTSPDGSIALERTPFRPLWAGEASPTVLVVEDNEANMVLACALLESFGCAVLPACNAGVGMDAAKECQPALILMDVQLPGMDGLTAIRILKKDPKTAHIPIVAVTAHAMKEHKTKALAAGCDGYLAKPINARELFEIVRRCLGEGP